MSEHTIELRFLGEVAVYRSGVPQTLPPSRKTRALLGYLAIRGGSHRRDKLCDLLWDVADDPRGALRWSLSKLRRLVDDNPLKRIVADRREVGFELHGASVDLLDLRAQLAGGAQALQTEQLEALAKRCRGELLEGIELPEFGTFNAWCVAEREDARRLHAALLRELVARLSSQPERALPFAQRLVPLDPLDDAVRARVIELLGGLGRKREAQEAYDAGVRLLRELGVPPSARLARAWREVCDAPLSPSRTIGVSHGPQGAPQQDALADAPQASTPEAPEVSEAPEASETPEAPEAPEAPAAQAEAPEAPAAQAEAPAAQAEAAPVVAGKPKASPSTLDLRAVSALTPLIGRARETSMLRAILDEAEGGVQKVVLLSGEPGLGKSRLLSQIMGDARSRSWTVLDGCAYDMERSRPYGAWVDALRRLARARPEVVSGSTLAPLLPELAERADQAAEEQTRDKLFGAVVDVLRALAPSATLLVLDDVQWLDESSAALLHYVMRKTRDVPLAIVLATRDGELADNLPMLRMTRSLARWGMTHLALAPLSSDEIGTLARGISSGIDVEKLHADSGGNPLFAIEMARASITPGSAREQLPQTLRQVVRERLERLSGEAADVLRWAAVLGPTFSVAHLSQLVSLDLELLITALEDLERFAVLRADDDQEDGYRFAHDVLHRAVYDELSGPRRRLMHLRAAQALSGAQSAPPAAAAGGAQSAPPAAAAATGPPRSPRVEPPVEPPVARALSEAEELMRSPTISVTPAPSAPPQAVAAPASAQLSDAGAAKPVTTDLSADLARMARHATAGGDSALAARSCLEAGRRCLSVFANSEAYMHAKSGLAYAQALAQPHRTNLTLELLEVSVGARTPRDVEATSKQLNELAERALELGSLSHARLGFHLAAFLHWDTGDSLTAREQIMRAERAIRGGNDNERVLAMSHAARCLVLLERELGQAEAMLSEVKAMEPRVDVEPASTPDALGMLRMHQGRADQAEEFFRQALVRARSRDDRYLEHSVLENLVELELLRDGDAAALGYARQALAIAQLLREGSEAPSARALIALCELRLAWADPSRHGELEALDGALDKTLDELRGADAKHRLARVLLGAGELELARGLTDRARGRAEEALDAARRLNRPTETALARVLIARVARAAGDLDAERRQIDLFAAQPPHAASHAAREAVEALLEKRGRKTAAKKTERKRWRLS